MGQRDDADGISAARRKLGLSQEELARQAGVGVRTIRRLEAGRPVLPSTIGAVRYALRGTPLGALGRAERVLVYREIVTGSAQATLVRRYEVLRTPSGGFAALFGIRWGTEEDTALELGGRDRCICKDGILRAWDGGTASTVYGRQEDAVVACVENNELLRRSNVARRSGYKGNIWTFRGA